MYEKAFLSSNFNSANDRGKSGFARLISHVYVSGTMKLSKVLLQRGFFFL